MVHVPFAIHSLPTGSSGVTTPFLSSLFAFISHVLNDSTPIPLWPLFFGARLVALTKKDGGVRPIAVGSTLRRLVANVAAQFVLDDMTTLLVPAARSYLNHLHLDGSMVKLDFRNAFNTVRHDKMLEATEFFVTEVYPFVYSSYSAASSLFWDGRII